jgi:[ribosomal protein S5]-alanine N-acetyltransferase
MFQWIVVVILKATVQNRWSIKQDMLLKTKNDELLLRSWDMNDARSLRNYADNHHIWKFMRDEFPHPFTLADAQLYIRTVCRKNHETRFAVVYRDEVIGDIHLTVHDDIRRYSAVLGYWLGEPFWNRGLMTEAVRRITGYAFESLKLARVYAKLFSTNTSSQKVLEKAGYHQEGLLKKAVFKENAFYDQLLYAKTVS